MHKKSTKVIAIVIACLFLLGVAAPLLANLVYGAPDDHMDQYEQRESSALKKMQDLERQMNETAERVYQLEQQLEDTENSLAYSDQELEIITRLEKQQKDEFSRRFSALCEGGTAAYLDMILSAASFSDFIDRLVIVREIMEYDRTILNAMEEVRTEIANEKHEQTDIKSKQENAKNELEAAMEDLYEKSAEAAEYYGQLEKDAEAYREYLAEKEAAEHATKKRAGIHSNSNSASYDVDVSWIHTGFFTWPTEATNITSDFSPNRKNPITGMIQPHEGTDIGAFEGEPIWAAKDGTIALAEENGGYGNCVIIDHGNGVKTLYGHMSVILVEQGQMITQGEQIGRVGSTGNSDGPHLHFEVLIDGVPVNPIQFF